MVDTLRDFCAALDAMLADLGLPAVPAAAVVDMVGKGSEHLIRAVLSHLQADPGLYAAAWQRYQHHYPRVNGRHSQVYPGVEQGLRALQAQGLALACLTNKPTAFALELLRAKGLDGFFSQVFGGDAFARKKPDPLPLLSTCQALGTAPAQTVMLGDSSNDAQAARAAGCPVVLVTYGYNHGQPARSVDADAWVDSLEDVAPLWCASA
jgi:phosphoglycolate phosphatase